MAVINKLVGKESIDSVSTLGFGPPASNRCERSSLTMFSSVSEPRARSLRKGEPGPILAGQGAQCCRGIPAATLDEYRLDVLAQQVAVGGFDAYLPPVHYQGVVAADQSRRVDTQRNVARNPRELLNIRFSFG